MGRRDELDRAEQALAAVSKELGTWRDRMEAVRKGIEALYEPHTHPVPWDGLRLGNGLPARWYCDDCRRQWPCQTFLELRRLHSATYGGEHDAPLPNVRLDIVSNSKIAL